MSLHSSKRLLNILESEVINVEEADDEKHDDMTKAAEAQSDQFTSTSDRKSPSQL